ncbi:DUF3373 family protein [Thiovibrio frasassiensis]|uniref:DUF3373 domain-containing protein n=1 Tax=Thiovibrio frasassiensis TaxID=2984131 RepID=A0A9X4MFL1_9BACT|nr:DUF3373 family protein [Thiovibrio frasassiensis]MDG4475365.1 DUF3373 domain-containing protein [Thiovibrio frasassiensis]
MVKKISTLALVGLLALPAMASAGAGGAAATADVQAQVDALTKQLNALKAQMADIKTTQDQKFESFDEKAEKWDLASRIQLSGDFRSRGDYYTRDRRVSNVAMFTAPGAPIAYTEVTDTNNSMMTNRFRLDMRAKALENVEFKGRLAMYKAWGMQSTPDSDGNAPIGAFPAFDGNATRTPGDSALQVDRAFVNWNNIGDSPVWFSVGRRPTTDGPAAQLRMGQDERMATPTAFMDWPFDGISAGYAYNNLFGMQDAPGRVRICYGRGFEAGLNQDQSATASGGINDTDFIGVSWDVYKKGNRFAYLQSFAAMDVFSYPDFSDSLTAMGMEAMMGARYNMGNIYHTSGVYQDKYENLNYFLTAAWSRTDPNTNGMLNDWTSGAANTDKENGYSVHLGVRYDIPDSLFKIGAEYNHGSKYWIAMTPGHDDVYASKLATRGNVYELYTIYDIPGGEAVSKFGKAFIRLGYQHYDYDFTGSMDWTTMPYDVNDDAEAWKANFAGQDIIDSADQVYLTFEAQF